MPCHSKCINFSSGPSGLTNDILQSPLFEDRGGGGAAGNYHCWLKHKKTGKIWDRTPLGAEPLYLKGKEVPFYMEFDTETQLRVFKECKKTLDNFEQNYLKQFISKPIKKHCFQNSYSIWSLDEDIRKNYHFKIGAFGYQTDDAKILGYCNFKQKEEHKKLRQVIALDYGY